MPKFILFGECVKVMLAAVTDHPRDLSRLRQQTFLSCSCKVKLMRRGKSLILTVTQEPRVTEAPSSSDCDM